MNRHLEPDVETVFLMTSLRFAYLSSSLRQGGRAAAALTSRGWCRRPVARGALERRYDARSTVTEAADV